MRRVELHSKEKDEKEEDHLLEMERVIFNVKFNVAVAIRKAKIRLAEDLENAGSWDVDGWREAIVKLTGKPTTANQYLYYS